MIERVFAVFIIVLSIGSLYAQDADVLKSNGIMYEGQQNYLKAAENYAAAVEAYKEEGKLDSLCVFKAGQNYVRIKDYSAALPFLKESVDIKYQDDHTYIVLADAYEGLNQIEEALEALERGMEVFPDVMSDYLKQKVYLLVKSKQYEEAELTFQQTLKNDPNNVEMRYLYATTNEKLGNYTEAIKQYETILKLDPDNKNTIKRLGYIYFKQTDELYKREKKRYESLSNPSRVDYSNSLKKLEQISEGFKNALPLLEKTHKSNPKDKTIISCLSVAYRRLNMDEKADDMKSLLNK